MITSMCTFMSFVNASTPHQRQLKYKVFLDFEILFNLRHRLLS